MNCLTDAVALTDTLFRWSEKDTDGKRIYRKRVIGTVEEFPDSEAARCSIAKLIATVNSASPQSVTESMTFAQLCAHFEQRELARNNTWRSYATKRCYAVYLSSRCCFAKGLILG
jgi:hypothetical protein